MNQSGKSICTASRTNPATSENGAACSDVDQEAIRNYSQGDCCCNPETDRERNRKSGGEEDGCTANHNGGGKGEKDECAEEDDRASKETPADEADQGEDSENEYGACEELWNSSVADPVTIECTRTVERGYALAAWSRAFLAGSSFTWILWSRVSAPHQLECCRLLCSSRISYMSEISKE